MIDSQKRTEELAAAAEKDTPADDTADKPEVTVQSPQ